MNPEEIREQIKVRLGKAASTKELATVKNELHRLLVAPLNQRLKEALPEGKRQIGMDLAVVKQVLEEEHALFAERLTRVAADQKLASERLDIDLPADDLALVPQHVLNQTARQMVAFFERMGFAVATGSEVVTEDLNFARLNIPADHPARETQESLYIDDGGDSPLLLRTHCTTVTAEYLAKHADQPDLRIVSAGSVYRNDDDDATHSHQFTQVDVFWVSATISLANLKWLLQGMCRELFGESAKIRMRPSFFPFTEPSFEVDVSCPFCMSLGCRVCKFSGWVEILGSGMLHPNVLREAGIDPKLRQGLAAGIGVERIAMLKHQVKDIRSFYSNDLRFLHAKRRAS